MARHLDLQWVERHRSKTKGPRVPHFALRFFALYVVAPPAWDQALAPRRDPPAPSFESIAQRKDVNADSLEHFLKTTHQGLDDPERMENPGLADFSGESRSSVYPEPAQIAGRAGNSEKLSFQLSAYPKVETRPSSAFVQLACLAL